MVHILLLLTLAVASQANMDVSINVTIKTGNDSQAQVRNDGSVILYGPGNRVSSKLILQGGFDRDAFKSFSFSVSEYLLPIRKVVLANENNVMATDGWWVDYVEVASPNLNQHFPCNMWLDSDEQDMKSERILFEDCANMPQYKLTITIKTGTLPDSGTANSGYVILRGPNDRSSEKHILRPSNGFALGSTEVFEIEVSSIVSPVCSLIIGNEADISAADGWFVDEVMVHSKDTYLKQSFNGTQWMDSDEGDFQLERSLDEKPMDRELI